MKPLLRGLLIAASVMTLALSPSIASEESKGVISIEDKAGLFSSEGITKAREAFEGTSFGSETHLLIVTADSIPSKKQAEWDEIYKNKDERGRNRFAEEWARAIGRTKDKHGDIVVLIYKSGTTYFVRTISDKQSDIHRNFSDTKAQSVSDVFVRELRKVKSEKLEGDAAKKEMDTALISATELVISDLKDTSAPDSSHKSGSANHAVAERKGSGIGGYICMILMVVLGIWLVIGLIRMFTGGGGGGGYGGGGGGGGGGFFGNMMGGMFGAMAGMWMYNNLFGGGFQNDAMAGDSYNTDTGDTGDGNFDDGASGGDGDWGDGGGGGDWGGGGGDWGGGGDFGGGDW